MKAFRSIGSHSTWMRSSSKNYNWSKMSVWKYILVTCLVAVCTTSTFAKISFDYTNCMEMKPQIEAATPANSFVLAYAKIYSVYISSSSFKEGSPIRVIIKSCLALNGVVHGMKAFLLQARTLDSNFRPIGHFNTTSVQTDAEAISCYYPYVSHHT